jgi:hypothetical protein
MGRPEPFQYGEAIHNGHHDVEKDRVRRRGVNAIQRLLPISRGEGVVLELFELLLEIVSH